MNLFRPEEPPECSGSPRFVRIFEANYAFIPLRAHMVESRQQRINMPEGNTETVDQKYQSSEITDVRANTGNKSSLHRLENLETMRIMRRIFSNICPRFFFGREGMLCNVISVYVTYRFCMVLHT